LFVPIRETGLNRNVCMLNQNTVDRSLFAAEQFIVAKQRGDGLWEDFHTLAGSSTDWVTAYVAHASSYCANLNEQVHAALKALLQRQRPNGGWSYSETVPTDCDSTAWALLALSFRPFCRPSVVRRAQRYIALHQNALKGGFSTYSVQDGIERYIGARSSRLTRGWRSCHACVTSAVVQALLSSGESATDRVVKLAIDYLLRLKRHGGLWRSYWWVGHGYTTYHALKALTMAGAIPEHAWGAVCERFTRTQCEDGGWSCRGKSEVFETAYMMLCLLLYPTAVARKCATKAAEWLIRKQEPAGSWPVTPILRIPPPMQQDPSAAHNWVVNALGTGVVIEDSGKVFTSVTALWALSLFRSIAL